MKKPLPSSTHRKASIKSNIKKMSTLFTEGKKQNSFFSVYPNTTKSHKHINLNYQTNYDIKKCRKPHHGLSSITYGPSQPYSLFSNFNTQRESSLNDKLSNFRLNYCNVKDKEVKIDYKAAADQGDNSIALSDQNYKDIIKGKDQDIDQLMLELNKAKEELVESKRKLALYNAWKKQSSFDLELIRDKDIAISKRSERSPGFVSMIVNENQASIEKILSLNEELIKEEKKKRKSYVISKGLNLGRSSVEVKSDLFKLKNRLRLLLEKKN